jgi:hypothetical protein
VVGILEARSDRKIDNPYDHWKPSLPSNHSLDAYIKAAESEGFLVCEPGWEAQYEKIVLCFDEVGEVKEFTHAARLVGPGRWKSKIGKLSDFEHPEDIGCSIYGIGRVYMRRSHILKESTVSA